MDNTIDSRFVFWLAVSKEGEAPGKPGGPAGPMGPGGPGGPGSPMGPGGPRSIVLFDNKLFPGSPFWPFLMKKVLKLRKKHINSEKI